MQTFCHLHCASVYECCVSAFVCNVVSVIFFWFFFLAVLCKFVLSYQLDCAPSRTPTYLPLFLLLYKHIEFSSFVCYSTSVATIQNKYSTKSIIKCLWIYISFRTFQIIADKVVYLFKLKFELITKSRMLNVEVCAGGQLGDINASRRGVWYLCAECMSNGDEFIHTQRNLITEIF